MKPMIGLPGGFQKRKGNEGHDIPVLVLGSPERVESDREGLEPG